MVVKKVVFLFQRLQGLLGKLLKGGCAVRPWRPQGKLRRPPWEYDIS